MKKLILALLAASTVVGAAPAAAAAGDVTGTVTLNGTVSNKCSVVNASNVVQPNYTATVNLNEIAGTNGLLVSSASLATLFGTKTFRVVCTHVPTGVSVDATSLVNSGAGSPPTGYANVVNYKAHAVFSLVPTATKTVNDDSTATPVATSDTLGARLAASGDNVSITADTFATPGATDVLMAGSYTGQVVVTITP